MGSWLGANGEYSVPGVFFLAVGAALSAQAIIEQPSLTLDAAEKMVNACESLAKTKGWKAVTPRMPGGKRGSGGSYFHASSFRTRPPLTASIACA